MVPVLGLELEVALVVFALRLWGLIFFLTFLKLADRGLKLI